MPVEHKGFLRYAWKSGLVLEVLVLMIFPYPFYDDIVITPQLMSDLCVPYFISNFSLLVMLLRLKNLTVFENKKCFSDLYS